MKGFDPLQMLTTVYILLSNSISIAVLLYEVSSPLKGSCVLPFDPQTP